MLKYDEMITDLKFELVDDILAIRKVSDVADSFYECPEEKRQSLVIVVTYPKHSVHNLEDHHSLILTCLVHYDILPDHRK